MEKVKIFRDKAKVPITARLVDTIPHALEELFIIRNPQFKSVSGEKRKNAFALFVKENRGIPAVFAYYPWQNIVVRIPNENIYFELRTARNKNIITREEQERYRNFRVGVIGLSVGLNVVNALVFSGGPKKLKIADYDTIAISNLNRLRAPVYEVGKNKTEFAAQYVWELDPFAEPELWQKGVNNRTLERFISDPMLDVFVDEMDSLDLKLKARMICRRKKIPVIMVTDNGDNVILDVERFDSEPKRKILHGLVEGVCSDTIKDLPYSEWVKVATRIVDPKNLTQRMQDSIKEIGKTIAAVPQLGTTATIAGSVASYAIRRIATKESMPSGRYFVSLDGTIST